MRPYMIEFLHTLVNGADHSNILEDFLYIALRSDEYIAMTRANAIIDIVVSRPLRWLAGNSFNLDNWSPLDMRIALQAVHAVFTEAANDGRVLLDPTRDIFGDIAKVQPLFAEWRRYFIEKEHVMSPDGSTPHHLFKLSRDELFDPKDATNHRSSMATT